MLRIMDCNAGDLARIAWLLHPDHTGRPLKVLISLEHYFSLQCCDEKPFLAVLAVKLDLKSDMDLKPHKGSRANLSTPTVTGRESNTLVSHQKRVVKLQVESYRLKVLNSCSD